MCHQPYVRFNKNNGMPKGMPLPCGKCMVCRKRNSNAWAFRLMQQDKASVGASFVTLTYDNAHVPRSQNNLLTLKTQDVQLFIKRLRERELSAGNTTPIRYYCVGEYGSLNERPHYHLIMFNVTSSIKDGVYYCPHVDASWRKGDVKSYQVNAATVGYTTKYLHKGKIVPKFKNDDRKPEYSQMSKGLGANYLSDEMVRYHKADYSRIFVTHPGGVRSALPRYYKDKIYDEFERMAQQDVVEYLQQEKRRETFEAFQSRTGLGRDEWYIATDQAREANIREFILKSNQDRKL